MIIESETLVPAAISVNIVYLISSSAFIPNEQINDSPFIPYTNLIYPKRKPKFNSMKTKNKAFPFQPYLSQIM